MKPLESADMLPIQVYSPRNDSLEKQAVIIVPHRVYNDGKFDYKIDVYQGDVVERFKLSRKGVVSKNISFLCDILKSIDSSSKEDVQKQFDGYSSLIDAVKGDYISIVTVENPEYLSPAVILPTVALTYSLTYAADNYNESVLTENTINTTVKNECFSLKSLSAAKRLLFNRTITVFSGNNDAIVQLAKTTHPGKTKEDMAVITLAR